MSLDGIYGPKTARAVTQFQRAFGLTVDGIVGKQTQQALAHPPYRGILRRGSKGNLVKVVQQKLGGIAVDGVFGAKTESKVREFQKAHGLKVDGIVGRNTWARLI
ncbi:peptidoglycan-binding domain-containing protein [Polycladospora coralii]|uniref:peptidoglycan-binding domain-containing protein n=1 Tax=Polycladospora coralii TaxID=2771432 RepID=UPI001746C333|nr:peptidoglycan-binding protein [Polycladospora coralii]